MCRSTPDATEHLTRDACLPDARYALMTRTRKLIEIALPLDAINEASAREKSIRHGHPSTLHLWWARRPLAAARAVIFAQMVDDPSEYVDVLLSDTKRKRAAKRLLKKRLAEHEARRALSGGQSDDAAFTEPEPTLEVVAAQLERERLFGILRELVRWENTTNEEVLERARVEIWQSWRRACAANADHPRAGEIFDRTGCRLSTTRSLAAAPCRSKRNGSASKPMRATSTRSRCSSTRR